MIRLVFFKLGMNLIQGRIPYEMVAHLICYYITTLIIIGIPIWLKFFTQNEFSGYIGEILGCIWWEEKESILLFLTLFTASFVAISIGMKYGGYINCGDILKPLTDFWNRDIKFYETPRQVIEEVVENKQIHQEDSDEVNPKDDWSLAIRFVIGVAAIALIVSSIES